MKKTLSLLLSLFLMTNISFAQTNRGYLEVSAGTTKSMELTMSLKGIFSHFKNEHLSIGGGLGLSYANHTINDKNKDYSIELPVFLNVRGNITKIATKKILYYSVSAGYTFPLKKALIEYSYTSNEKYNVIKSYSYNNGLFFAPELGISYKRLSFGAEIMYVMSKCTNTTKDLYDTNGHFVTEYSSTEVPNLIISLKITGRL